MQIGVKPKVRVAKSPSEATARDTPVLCSTNTLFRRAVNWKNYRLNDRSSRYDKTVVSKQFRMIRDDDEMIRGKHFDGIDRIGVLDFLHRFQDACDTKNVQEGAAKWIFKSFLKGNPLKNVTGRLLESKTFHKAGGVVTNRKKGK